jgi:hypothetical protein
MSIRGFRKGLFIMVACLYLAAICYVVSVLVDVQRSRFGSLAVTQVSIKRDATSGRQLVTLAGSGFDDELRALAVTELERAGRSVFLEGFPLRCLWSDGQTLLTSYQGTQLLYLRVNDGEPPVVTGFLQLPGRIGQIEKVGDRAIVSVKGEGLFLVDLTDPEQPRLVGRLASVDNLLPEMESAAGVVYIPDRQGRLHFVDLRKTHPEVGSLDLPGSVWQIAVLGDRLISATLEGDLRLFDLGPEGAPQQVGDMQFAAGIVGVGLTAEGLFVALHNGELRTFSVRNWPQLEQRGSLQIDGRVLRLMPVPGEPLLMLSRSLLGLLTVNVEKLDQPRIVASFREPLTPLDFCLAGKQVFAVSSAGLSVLDLAEVLAGSVDNVTMMAGREYDLHGWNGQIFLLSASGPEQPNGRTAPSLLALPPPAGCGQNCRSLPDSGSGDLAPGQDCLAAPKLEAGDAIHLFCEEPGNARPRLEATIILPERELKSIWRDDAVFSVSRNGMLRVFDTADRRRPVWSGQLRLPGELYDFGWLEPHYLLVAAGSAGMLVVSVEDLARPRQVAQLVLPEHLQSLSPVRDVLVDGQRAFLALGRNGLSMVDVSDPLQPRFLRGVDTSGFSSALAVFDGLLFASVHRQGVYLVDLGDGRDWLPVGLLDTPVRASELAAGAGRLAVAGGQSGIGQMVLPRKLEIRVERDGLARIELPEDLAPGEYRLYLYNGDESQPVRSAFRIPAHTHREVAQNE